MERKEKELPTLLFFLRRCPTNNTVSPFSREREREREREERRGNKKSSRGTTRHGLGGTRAADPKEVHPVFMNQLVPESA